MVDIPPPLPIFLFKKMRIIFFFKSLKFSTKPKSTNTIMFYVNKRFVKIKVTEIIKLLN